MRALFYAQFEEMRNYLALETGIDWVWEPIFVNAEGKEIARIYCEQSGVSLYNKPGWGPMLAFLAARIVALDRVWADCGDVFKDLADA